MNETRTRYDAADRPLTAVLEAVPGAAWNAASPCEGWTAADVVAHLVSTEREFLTGRGLELGDAPDVAADPAGAWRAHAQRVREALTDDVVATPYEGYFGPSTIGETFERFYVWDMVVHRWDVATAAGVDAGLTDAELDSIDRGADGFGPALHSDGVCAPEVTVPADADRATRVLARLGRRA
ncbi:maleylpyruvate isomerase family mycothiol-dependent enzyme [Blastococcus sp. TML/M2B]|uniref:maleylpyruvate isomerase family mycothiol-dependent enzyme n=1 Tax=Blastococcus sp. TML/M2B TaxID=2798727 RepID=UPI00190E3477|nr:maleylpyruvate isomerase family mycothiol-dependent enzyme [Blastococcus sp. TML/M2B]MBN1093381.1 maleylpyruvate isomerase family mycothiol-dependent enzyme [Blastococcus sp. TML/M2B]